MLININIYIYIYIYSSAYWIIWTTKKFTLESSTSRIDNQGNHIQELPFLDVLVIVTNYKFISTDIFYKETDSHFYLDYHSHHPQHIKDNIPYGLAKKIVVFVSDDEKEKFSPTRFCYFFLIVYDLFKILEFLINIEIIADNVFIKSIKVK